MPSDFLHDDYVCTVPIRQLRSKRYIVLLTILTASIAVIIVIVYLVLQSHVMNQDENKDLSGEGVSDKFILSSLLPSFAPSPVLKPSEMPTPFPTNIYSSADPSSYPSLLPSQFPTWISHSPSILPTSSPSEITGKPSIPKISRRPTSNPSWQPSQNPTSSSSLHPSKVLSQVPTEAISTNSSQLTHDESEIKFYVLGDVPYNRKEEIVFISQLQAIQDSIINDSDNSQFIVHVGDLMSAHFSKCREERYETISSIMKTTTNIPVFTTPGDNEWNKCPNTNLAIQNYTKYFIGMEKHWEERNISSVTIVRSTFRPENWVLYKSNVLFLAINMIFDDDTSNEFETTKRLQDNLEWFKKNCNQYCMDARAIIIFGHSIKKASDFFDAIHERLFELDIPVVYFTGDGHNYFVKRGVGKGEVPGNYFWRVQVDNGMNAPPIQVTIRNNYQTMVRDDDFLNLDDHQVILSKMIKIDRRGGSYEYANYTDHSAPFD